MKSSSSLFLHQQAIHQNGYTKRIYKNRDPFPSIFSGEDHFSYAKRLKNEGFLHYRFNDFQKNNTRLEFFLYVQPRFKRITPYYTEKNITLYHEGVIKVRDVYPFQ